MANAPNEIPEVVVTGRTLVPIEEFDRVKSTVCLLKSSDKGSGRSWSASGFYVNVIIKKKDGRSKDAHCIMTNFHVFREKEENNDEMVAVFHHEGPEKKPFEFPLKPFSMFASNKELDYILIRVNESFMRSIGVKPLLADADKLPNVKKEDKVWIFQHPGGMKKHFSEDKVKSVDPPYIEYYPDTKKGSSGSPVVMIVQSKYVLVALHSMGVEFYKGNWNKGVLISGILDHLQTGIVPKPALVTHGVPDQMEYRTGVVGTKDPSTQVSRNDIIYIAKDITDEWQELGRALLLSDSTLKIIDADKRKIYHKCYEMLLKWTQIKVSDANYGALASGFAHPTVNRPDLITKYC